MTDFDPQSLNDPRALRNAFGCYMTGVTVVTTQDEAGNPLGFTANSFASVSLKPPLVLICMANTSSNYDVFSAAGKFAINILSEEQIEISNTFARPVEDRFANVAWSAGPHGSPILEGVSAWFDCSMHRTIDGGDHLVLMGEVKAFDYNPAPGLGYVRGAYVTPAAEAEALSRRAGMVVSALIERNRKVLLIENGDGRLTLPATDDISDGVSAALASLISESGLTAEPGFIYSVYEDATHKHQHISFLCQATDGEAGRGRFTELDEAALAKIGDPAMRTMLERYAEESRLGNFGVYFGNEVSGKVKPIMDRGGLV